MFENGMFIKISSDFIGQYKEKSSKKFFPSFSPLIPGADWIKNGNGSDRRRGHFYDYVWLESDWTELKTQSGGKQARKKRVLETWDISILVSADISIAKRTQQQQLTNHR